MKVNDLRIGKTYEGKKGRRRKLIGTLVLVDSWYSGRYQLRADDPTGYDRVRWHNVSGFSTSWDYMYAENFARWAVAEVTP